MNSIPGNGASNLTDLKSHRKSVQDSSYYRPRGDSACKYTDLVSKLCIFLLL